MASAPGTRAAAREPATTMGRAARSSIATSFVPSPTASTAPGDTPAAAQNASIPDHFETPGGIAFTPQPGNSGSGAKSCAIPAAARAATAGSSSAGGRPTTASPYTGWERTTSSRSGSRRATGRRYSTWSGCVDGSGPRTTSTSGSPTYTVGDRPWRANASKAASASPARNTTSWNAAPPASRPIAPLRPTIGSESPFASSSSRAPRGRRAVAARTATPAPASARTAARVRGPICNVLSQRVPSRSVATTAGVARRVPRSELARPSLLGPLNRRAGAGGTCRSRS